MAWAGLVLSTGLVWHWAFESLSSLEPALTFSFSSVATVCWHWGSCTGKTPQPQPAPWPPLDLALPGFSAVVFRCRDFHDHLLHFGGGGTGEKRTIITIITTTTTTTTIIIITAIIKPQKQLDVGRRRKQENGVENRLNLKL